MADERGQQAGGFQTGWVKGFQDQAHDLDANEWERLSHNSFFNLDNIKRAFRESEGASETAGYLAAAFTKDIASDGTRIIYWALNHPLAITSMFAEGASRAAGLSPDLGALQQQYMEKNEGRKASKDRLLAINAKEMGWAHNDKLNGYQELRGIPQGLASKVIPLMAATAMIQASGNHDLLNLAEGGRAPGFKPILPDPIDPTKTNNAPLELAARYLFGRRGGVLPWENFTLERPEISPTDHAAYQDYQGRRGFLGVVKSTARNLEGEPEFEMMGFRTPFSAATTAGGTMIGGIAGANAADVLRQRMELNKATSSPMKKGPVRLAGAVLGGLIGAATGNVGGKVVNSTLIQPALAPERQQAQQLWEQQQRQAGNI